MGTSLPDPGKAHTGPCLVIGCVAWFPVVDRQAEETPLLFWIDLLVGLVCFGLVMRRRRWPLQIAVVATLMTPLTSIGAGAILLAIVSLATGRRWWQIIGVAALNLAMTAVYYQVQPVSDTDPGWLIALVSVMFLAAASAWGMYIGSRRELLWTLRQLSNAEIAAELFLSVPTVKAHVSRLFDKLEVTNRVQIAVCIHDAGLA